MLISGYFGIKFSVEKMITIEWMLLTYSIFGAIISYGCSGSFSAGELLKALFPIATKKYWYMSVYVIFMFFSKYINMISEKLSKKNYFHLLLLLFAFFSIMPTLVYYEITGDGGKGVINMLLMYLIGRYIAIYDVSFKKKKLIKWAFLMMGCGFGVNYLMAYIGGGVGLKAPMARDNSITIVLGSICVFLIFKKYIFYSRTINRAASYVLAIYILESTVRKVLDLFIDWEYYADKWYLFAIIAGYTITVMVICIFVEIVRKSTLGHLDRLIYKLVQKIFHSVKDVTIKFLDGKNVHLE